MHCPFEQQVLSIGRTTSGQSVLTLDNQDEVHKRSGLTMFVDSWVQILLNYTSFYAYAQLKLLDQRNAIISDAACML